MRETYRDCPAESFRLLGGPLTLAGDAGGDPAGGESGEDTIPVRLLARTAEAVDHPYWGRIIHDLEGMSIDGDRVPIDNRHDPDQVIGYAEKFERKRAGLFATGALVPFGDDSAREIAYKAARGVPYQASIDFRGPTVIEELSEGTSTKVNGRAFKGPGYVVRQWKLRAIAICELGADPGTRAIFEDDGPATIRVLVRQNDNESEGSMSAPTKPPADEPVTRKGLFEILGGLFSGQRQEEPAEAPPTTPEAAPVTPEAPAAAMAADSGDEIEEAELARQRAAEAARLRSEASAEAQAEIKRFSEAFGEAGLAYYSARKSFEAAAVEHIAALNATIEDQRKKLASVDRGEDRPANFTPEDGEDGPSARAQEFQSRLGERLGRFAAGIRLPRRADGRGNGKR